MIPYKPREQQKRMHSGMEGKRFSVIVAHRRFGKTVAVINHMIKMAILNTRQDPHYGYIAPYRNQAETLAWKYLKRYSNPIPGVKVNESKLEITLPNSATIRIYGADNPDNLRGVYFDGVVLDEVAQMRPEIWDEIIPPTIADRQGWVVFIGTPKGINLFYKIYLKAVSDSDQYYADIFTVEGTDALPESEIAVQKSTLPPNKFRQEYMCDFSADVEDALIPLQFITDAYGRSLHPDVYRKAPIVIGVDVARFGDDKSVIYVRQGLATVEIRKFNQTDLFQFSENVMASMTKHKPDAVFVDDVGVGAGVVDIIKAREFSVSGINGGSKPRDESMFVNKRAEMWWSLREWLASGASIPEDPELREELAAPVYSYDAANRVKLEKKEDMKARGVSSPDIADALALTFAQPVFKRKHEFLNRPKVWEPFGILNSQRSI